MAKGVRAPHKCDNRFFGDGAKGACYVEIEPDYVDEEKVHLAVGWSCVVVHNKSIPISWLAEIIAVATGHAGGIEGFLIANGGGGGDKYGGSYALMCNPPEGKENARA